MAKHLYLYLLLPLLAYAQTPAASQAWNGSVLSPVNSEMPEWLHFSGEYRSRAEGYTGGAYTSGNNQGYLLSRFQLNMDAHYSWFRVFAQMEDSRVLGNSAIPDAFPYQDAFDLRQAFVELGDMDKSHFGLRVGRQELMFGEQRILGSANWLNTPRTFDAVRADVTYGRVRLDAFSSSVVNPIDGTFDHHKDGEDLHGLYGSITRVLPGTSIEPYFLWHLGGGFKSEEGLVARRSSKTLAYRMAGKSSKHVDYVGHLLRQFGTLGRDSISAYAMNFNLGYKWPDAMLQPRIFADFAYASGDKNAKDGKINTFDQMYPSNHGLYGIVDLFGWRNLEDLKAGLEVRPMRKLLFSTVVHNLYLANSHDGLYNGVGNLVVRKADGSAGDHIGQELEETGTYAFTKYFSAGIGFGHLFPGQFVKTATKGSSYNISYLVLTYSF